MPEYTETEIDTDFQSALRRAGLKLPPDRLPAMRESYVRYLDMVRILDEPLGYLDEPALVFHLLPTPEPTR